MSITPPDPNVIRANLDAPNAGTPFTAREAKHFNSPDRMQVDYGIDDASYIGAGQIHGGTDSVFTAIPGATSRKEYYETIQYFGEGSDAYFEPDQVGEWVQGTQLTPQGPAYGWGYENQADAKGGKSSDYQSPTGQHGAPAPITEAPTSSSNPPWPRTVAAGYDPTRKCLTVVFRDGTYYNYYEVNGGQWYNFVRARSKGEFIYTHLDHKPRGKADVSALPEYAREALYRVSRTGQVNRQGVTGRQSLTSPRANRSDPRNRYKSGNLGGTGRKRLKKLGSQNPLVP